MEVYQTHGGIFLSQHRYLRQLIETYNMSNCNPLSNPMNLNSKLSHEDNSPIFEDITKYRRLIGSLLHLTYTSPDLSYAQAFLKYSKTKSLASNYLSSSIWPTHSTMVSPFEVSLSLLPTWMLIRQVILFKLHFLEIKEAKLYFYFIDES